MNLPFGETFVEQQIQNKYENSYKFNAKELHSETGVLLLPSKVVDIEVQFSICLKVLFYEQ
ncbi:hypothetical protein A0O34_21670 [Chryseobacterium glaciei]|uniref:Uncharacterized protein n=1 Tax=Chryseobacterium glaciei TaxID=1685010 RepID=A0A172Y1I8_9FLAO|nr:hypothetical protein A0O34_21670 [Chryseobacterium glaciei]